MTLTRQATRTYALPMSTYRRRSDGVAVADTNPLITSLSPKSLAAAFEEIGEDGMTPTERAAVAAAPKPEPIEAKPAEPVAPVKPGPAK